MTERALPVTILEPAGIDHELLDHSLSLRFDLRQFDPRITFTRNSSATYFGSDGLLKTAAANEPRIDYDPVTKACKGFLVEESRTNLLTYSEQFDNASWTKSATSATANAISAPDGTITADKIVENINNGAHAIRNIYAIAANTSYSASIYVKAGERTSGTFLVFDNNSNIGAWHINLLTGELAQGSVSLASTAKATNVGNGWWRISVSFVSSAAPSGSYFDFRLSNTWPIAAPTGSAYIGDNTSGIYVWGAQIEVGSFPTSYIPTPATFTSRNSTGTYFDSTGVMKTAAINEPRYDHALVDGKWVSKGLILEPARTNLFAYSEQFNNSSWTKTRSGVTGNATTAPNGTSTAFKFFEDTSVNLSHVLRFTTATYASGSTYTFSFYLKAAERSFVYFQFRALAFPLNQGILFDLNNSTIVRNDAPAWAKASIADAGNGWRRIEMTAMATITYTGSEGFYLYLVNSEQATTYTGDGASGVYIWGAQLEESPWATSYIKTESSAVTRAADLSTSSAVTRAADSAVMTGANFSSWYRQDEGTVYLEWWLGLDKESVCVYSINGSSTSNEIRLRYNVSGTGNDTAVTTDGASQASLSTTSALNLNTLHKNAMAYKSDDFARSVNGESVIKDSSGMLPTVNVIHIGSRSLGSEVINGHINRIAYYPKRLTNAKLQALTQ